MKAVGKYIVIKPIKSKELKTSGGLILGETHREDVRYKEAEIIAVGDAVNAINKKDKVYYDKASGFNIEVKNKIYKVIKEHDVVIIL